MIRRYIGILVAMIVLVGNADAKTISAGHHFGKGPLPSSWQPVCPFGVPTQTITVIDQAHADHVIEVEHAISLQSLQLRRYWNTPCVIFGAGGWKVYLKVGGRNTYPNGAHFNQFSVDSSGLPQPTAPYALVWTAGDNANSWSHVLSHEVEEMLVNPHQQTLWDGHNFHTDGIVTVADEPQVEISDPVDGIAYHLAGIYVSDAVTPSWYAHSVPPYDLRHQLRYAGQSVTTG